MPRLNDVHALSSFRDKCVASNQQYSWTVTMCAGTACRACGCMPVIEAMRKALAREGLLEEVRLRTTGCHGFCEQGPLVIIEPGNILYAHVRKRHVSGIVARTLKQGEVIEELLYADPVTGKRVGKERDIPFYASQDRALLDDNMRISPSDVEDYIAVGGYAALAKVLDSMSREEVIAEVKASGLRGRGGGGYSTGRKWEQCKAARGEEHYVICNADEGDPGAYIDRSLLEGTRIPCSRGC